MMHDEATTAATHGYIENKDDPEVLKLASMCKLKSGRLARELVDGCLQYWGGMGFMNETRISREPAPSVVIFGASRLPLLGKGLGEGISNFRDGLKGRDDKNLPKGPEEQ